MAGELEKSFETLNKCLVGNTPKDFSDAKDSVLNIYNYFEDELSRPELDSAFPAVFAEKTGILNFFYKASSSKNFKNAIIEVFELLKYLVHHFQERVTLYVLAIKEACMACASQFNASAAEKEKAFDVLILILKRGPWGQDLEIVKLIDSLFEQVGYHSPTPKVSQKIYHILGVIAHHYPECMAQKSEKLLRMYCSVLDKQIRFSNKISYPVVAGCLDGLAEYMCTFSPSPDDNPDVCKKIYGYVKELSSPDSDRRVAHRAALGIIELHGSQLATYLYAEYRWWHTQLLKWQTMNSEDRKAGLNALNTFYQEISRLIQESTNDQDKIVLMFFINFFKEKMLNQNVTVYEMGEVIKGFGMFAGPCMAHMSHEDVEFMFTLLIQRAQQVYLNYSLEQVQEQKQKGLQNLPDYMESIASIILQLGNVAPDQLAALRHLTVFFFQNFANVPTKFHSSSIKAFTALFHSLAICKGVLFEDFIKIIVYQGVVRTCSHPVAIDVELQKEQSGMESKFISYKNYVPLWLAFLSIQSYEVKDITLATKRAIVRKLYDQLLQTVLILLGKLDLSTTRRTDWSAGQEYDTNTGLQATTPQDFQVFINLVDLCVDVLPNTDHHMFEKWVQSFTYHIIMESSRKPLVSGFYKLLTISLQLSDKLCYFSPSSDADDVQPAELRASCELVCQFLQDMMARLKHYKGDLQIACLQALLATPVSMVPGLLHEAAEAFQAVFKVGRSFLQIAHQGLAALEKWTNTLPSKDIQPLLKKILPYLEPFLQSRGLEDGTDTELELLEADRGTSIGKRRRRLTRKRLVERPDTELTQLQRRILHFLGPLDCDTAEALLLEQSETSSPWGHTKKLEFIMPFKDMRPCIYLDQLLPRIVEITLSSSDRHTRVAACELLHAIVMFMLGTSKQVASSNVSEQSELSELFQKLFLPLLQLGCDTDQVVYQLFHPLLLQLTHWYSSTFQLRSKETAVLVVTLLELKGIKEQLEAQVQEMIDEREGRKDVDVESNEIKVNAMEGNHNEEEANELIEQTMVEASEGDRKNGKGRRKLQRSEWTRMRRKQQREERYRYEKRMKEIKRDQDGEESKIARKRKERANELKIRKWMSENLEKMWITRFVNKRRKKEGVIKKNWKKRHRGSYYKKAVQ